MSSAAAAGGDSPLVALAGSGTLTPPVSPPGVGRLQPLLWGFPVLNSRSLLPDHSCPVLGSPFPVPLSPVPGPLNPQFLGPKTQSLSPVSIPKAHPWSPDPSPWPQVSPQPLPQFPPPCQRHPLSPELEDPQAWSLLCSGAVPRQRDSSGWQWHSAPSPVPVRPLGMAGDGPCWGRGHACPQAQEPRADARGPHRSLSLGGFPYPGVSPILERLLHPVSPKSQRVPVPGGGIPHPKVSLSPRGIPHPVFLYPGAVSFIPKGSGPGGGRSLIPKGPGPGAPYRGPGMPAAGPARGGAAVAVSRCRGVPVSRDAGVPGCRGSERREGRREREGGSTVASARPALPLRRGWAGPGPGPGAGARPRTAPSRGGRGTAGRGAGEGEEEKEKEKRKEKKREGKRREGG